MNPEKNILTAFLLNLFFAVFELIGGIFTSSVAIMSDAIHDIGDALSIGLSYLFEKKSKKEPDDKYSYGYTRYSVLGGVMTNVILIAGSFIVIAGAIDKITNPAEIHKNGMIILAIIGAAVNLVASFFTRGEGSYNQKAVNLHMLEDVLGWIAVLIGSILIKLTDLIIIDPLISIAVSLFILYRAFENLKQALDLFLEKTPDGTDMQKIKEHIMGIDGVIDVHHIHIWSLDTFSNYATMHIVTDDNPIRIKQKVKHELLHFGIHHATLELEDKNEQCKDKYCHTHILKISSYSHHHYHHSHGHHHHC